jgi:hypothetical protein
MRGNNNSDFTYEINKKFDFVLEEGDNTSINLRKISWNGRPEKLDIRKYVYEDGKEKMMKGISLSDEAANELANRLVENNYGDTNKLIDSIKMRSDFTEALISMPNDEIFDPDEDEEYYDPKELLG